MKPRKKLKKLTLTTVLFVCGSILFLFWFDQAYLEKSKEGISPALNQKLLVITQSSPFKDSIKSRVLEHYKSTDLIIEHIDVKELAKSDVKNYGAILILHRWEAGAPYKSLQTFMENNQEAKSKMVILTTSWNGLEKMENIDAITGASIQENIPVFTDRIVKELDQLLKNKR